MKTQLALLSTLVATCFSTHASPPFTDQPLTADTVKVSEHVSAIIGFPNVGIVVGKDAVLVVDTGLGRHNGETVMKAVRKLAPHRQVYLTTTHFHPEHAGGVLGFPKDTILIRDKVQQDEMDKHGEEMIKLFASKKDLWKSWLKGQQLRAPNELFDRELELNLGGGVTARLLWFGPAHTKGDEVVLVDPDKTLISGDVVQNKVSPHIFNEGGTAASWIADIEQIEKLGVQHVLPDHSPIADGSVIAEQKAFLSELRAQALAFKKDGKTVEQAGEQMTAEAHKKYPTWNIDDLTSFAKAAYAE